MLNKMLLQGRLTRDPEQSTTDSGVARTRFNVAWSERRGENEQLLFLSCTAWRGTAEFIAKYFTKGQEIIIEGPLTWRKYTGKDGVERTALEMSSVDKVHFCGPKRDNPPAAAGSQYAGSDDGFVPVSDDDLPF